MSRKTLVWIGLAGVEANDSERAQYWQLRLHRLMIGIACLALPGYLLDSALYPSLQRIATMLDGLIFCAFLAETIWMAHLANRPGRYLLENWLNLLILAGTFASLLGAATSWIALVRIVRVAILGLLVTRTVSRFGFLFTRKGAPLLIAIAVLITLCAGGMFYWLEPTVTTYWDGLWLAFVTGTTVGYGDVVPTSGPARMLAAVTALIGVSLLALLTANIVSFFDRDEKRLAHSLRADVHDIRDNIARLVNDHSLSRTEFEREMSVLRRDIGVLASQLAAREGKRETPSIP